MSTVITTRVDADTLALLDRVAGATGQSRSAFAARAIQQAVAAEANFLASLDEAEAEIERGECYTQAEVEAWLRIKIDGRSTSHSNAG